MFRFKSHWYSKILFLCIILAFIAGCSTGRTPITPGEIPTLTNVDLSEEQYGQEVFRQLSEKFPIDQDDNNVIRVRKIVDRLTKVRGNDKNIWHVYVFKDDSFRNAAATRGNHIFIWTGMINAIKSNDELAAILAHEIAHVLAGHTMPTPQEAVNDMMSQVAGSVAREAIYAQGGQVAALAGVGQALVGLALQAAVINPEKQRVELEADMIGFFMMAEAGYNPQAAIEFWRRAESDPAFRNSALSFLSSHPSSKERLEQLEVYLPAAQERRSNGPVTNRGALTAPAWVRTNSAQPLSFKQGEPFAPPISRRDRNQTWRVVEPRSPVYESQARTAKRIGWLERGETLEVIKIDGRWLEIAAPIAGYTPSTDHSPE